MRQRFSFKSSFTPFVFGLTILIWPAIVPAQTTSFTYQGRLTDSGTSANGNYDLQFALFDSLSGGSQVGSTQTLNTVAVSNGVFTVSLDFGANAFPGANRFLQISARTTGAGSFTLLTPRQPVTSTPYAVRSLNATSADSVPASGVPSGSMNYIQNSSSPQGSSNFNISGNGTAGGTLSGGVINATTQYNINGSRILSSPGSQNLFAGNGAGSANTTGTFNAFFGDRAGEANKDGAFNSFFGGFTGVANTTGFSNSFFGLNAGSDNTIGSANTFIGAGAGSGNKAGDRNTIIGANADIVPGLNATNATAIGYNARVGASNALVLGSIDGFNGGPDTNVGIGTPAPIRKLHLKGLGSNGLGFGDLLITGTGTVGSAITFESTGIGGRNYSWISTANSADSGGGKLAVFDVTAGAYRMVIDNTGRVGIGTTGPDQALSVNGNASKTSGGAWLVFSDERLKNIKGRFTPGLQAVMRLQPLRYEYKRDNALTLKSEGEHIGFSAQAVQKVIPEAVTANDKGYLLVNNDPILWTMLNAIKEQQAQIQQQQKLIERQQALAVRQQQQLNALKRLACRSHRRAGVCQ